MRTEEEIRELMAHLKVEYECASAEMTPDPIRVTNVGAATYQISLRQTAVNIAQGINILRWVLGEFDIPNANSNAR